jgi:ribosomal protein S18 acetylase RimI-like enzyme
MNTCSEPISLSIQEIDEMADITSRAFIECDNFRYIIPKVKKRKIITYYIFRLMFKVINKHGYIFRVSRDNKNIAYITYLDASNKEQISFKRIVKTKGFKDVILFLLHINLGILIRFINYYKIYNSHIIKNDVKTIHLYTVGILSEYRSQGIMGIELRKSFNYFFNRGYKRIILETSDIINVPIYEKLGFKIEEIITKKSQSIYFFKHEQQVE